jgi:hypothetical protein
MTHRLLTTEDHEAANALCSNALLDTSAIPEWLTKHADLYKSCVIQPAGLPAISMCYHQGEYFEAIADFTSLYERRANPDRFWTDEDYMNMEEDFTDEGAE